MTSVMHPISLTSLVDGALTVAGVGVAMAAMLVLVNAGLWLQWMLGRLDVRTAAEAGVGLAPRPTTRGSAEPARARGVPAARPAAEGAASPAIARP